MKSLLSFWLLTALALYCPTSLTVAIDYTEYCVRPSDSVSCQHSHSPCSACHTIYEYAERSSHYFLHNRQFNFLAGAHHLNITLNLLSITNIRLFGDEKKLTQISISKGISITWINCVNAEIRHLAFTINGLDELDEQYSVVRFQKSTSSLSNLTFSGENNFRALFINDSHKMHFDTVHISGASSQNGAALYAENSSVTFVHSNSFRDNRAELGGGAIALVNCSSSFGDDLVFVNNFAVRGSGGAINITYGTHHLSGNFNFTNNRARIYGGAMNIFHSNLTASGNISLINNTADFEGGGIMQSEGNLHLSGNISFINNVCTYDGGGAMEVNGLVEKALLNLTGILKFINNSAYQGGAMAFYGQARLRLTEELQMNFTANHANFTGGAVIFTENPHQCVDPRAFAVKHKCPIELSSETNIHLNFYNNTADVAGTILYGGVLDNCRLDIGGEASDGSDDPIKYLKSISTITTNDNETAEFVSDSLKVCICKDSGELQCTSKEIETITGKEITLKAVVVGLNDEIVPTSARIYLDDVNLSDASEQIQKTGRSCFDSVLKFTLLSDTSLTSVTLVPDCRAKGLQDMRLNVHFNSCPDLCIQLESRCVVDDRLQPFNAICNVENNFIERNSNSFWIGAVYVNESYVGLLLHSGSCPFDFCIDTPVNITRDNLDIQCNHNHSGTLCGPCKKKLSIVLGTLRCHDCKNTSLTFILLFALAGIILVAVLLLLNLTVSVGTINDLIFYANVVQANRSRFFPPEDTNMPTVFIAWLNLDLGIETCFYDEMDTYAFTWLQYLFPLYVWILIGMIIIVSRHSRKVAQSLGNNPVPTLATLFLLCYSKILRNIIATLSVTNLSTPNGTHQLVWLYDGSVPYFQRADHIVLGLFAIVILLFLFLPYTLLLLLGQYLQAYSHYRIFSWLNKIKPFMDAYHAPYKKETRYWTGLIMLVRCVLFLAFAVNSLSDSPFDLLFTTTVTSCLAGLAWIHGGVYEKVRNDILEAWFILNVGVLSAATFHVKETRGNQAALVYTSVGIAFALFVIVFLYHVYLLLSKTTVGMKFTHSVFLKNYRVVSNERHETETDNEELPGGAYGTTAPINFPKRINVAKFRESLLSSVN